jgi:hypothetical protein
MAANYTVIVQVRQWFGDRSARGDDHVTVFGDWETAPFVGISKDYDFDCPNVDSAQEAVLQFQAQGVETKNILQINGQDISGGLTAAPLNNEIEIGGKGLAWWSVYSLIVRKNLLRTNNVLRIESVVNPFTGFHDDFIVDNVVLFYKMRRPNVSDPGGIVAIE